MVAIGNNARAGEIGGRLLLRLLACLCVVSVWLLLCSDRFEMGWGPDAGFIGGRQGRWRPARRPVTRLTVVGRGGGHVGGSSRP